MATIAPEKATIDSRASSAVRKTCLLSRCARGALAIERAACMTGTAWGLLANAPLWILTMWWIVRHGVYFGLSTLIVVYGDRTSFAVLAVFFLVVHLYKVIRFSQAQASDDSKRASCGIERADAAGVSKPSRGDKELCDA